jgi:hypothetical protein
MIRASLFALALLTAACGPTSTPAEEPAPAEPVATAPTTREEATAQDTCGASGYASLVGSNVAAITIPAGLNHRIIAPDTPVTMDFNAERINFLTDANGVITSVECY